MKGRTTATLRTWAARLASLFRRREMDARLDEELSFHVEQEARALEARGLSPGAARREIGRAHV